MLKNTTVIKEKKTVITSRRLLCLCLFYSDSGKGLPRADVCGWNHQSVLQVQQPDGGVQHAPWEIPILLHAVPWWRRAQRHQRRHHRHQDDAHHPVRWLVPHWLQGNDAVVISTTDTKILLYHWSLLFSAILHCRADSLHSCRMWFRMSDRSLFITCFEYPLKWCFYSVIWLLHGWCQVKPLPFRRTFCVHHTTMDQFKVSFSWWKNMCARARVCVCVCVCLGDEDKASVKHVAWG